MVEDWKEQQCVQMSHYREQRMSHVCIHINDRQGQQLVINIAFGLSRVCLRGTSSGKRASNE